MRSYLYEDAEFLPLGVVSCRMQMRKTFNGGIRFTIKREGKKCDATGASPYAVTLLLEG